MTAIGGQSGLDMLNVSSSPFDPIRTSASVSCCRSEAGFSLYQSIRLNRYDASSCASGWTCGGGGSPCVTTDGRLQMFRTFLATITLAAPAIVVAPLPSHAQSDYPNRIVKIVVPHGAGTVPSAKRSEKMRTKRIRRPRFIHSGTSRVDNMYEERRLTQKRGSPK